MASASFFAFRFTARRCLHIYPRPAGGTGPGRTRNFIVPSSSAWSQLPRNYGGQDNLVVSKSTLNISLSVRNYSTSPVVQASVGRHWYIERLASVGLLALIPAGLVYPNPAVDYGLALLVPLHGHWGLMAVAKDYTPEILMPAAKGLVYILSIGTFAGLMYLNMRDVGICGAVRAVWSL